MGQELEASANGFLGEFFLQRVAFSKDLMNFLPGGVQIVRTKNQNIPDVSFLSTFHFCIESFWIEKLDIAGDV